MSERTKHHEVQLIMMRFLSVLMSKTKSSTKLASEVSMYFTVYLKILSLGKYEWENQTDFFVFVLPRHHQ